MMVRGFSVLCLCIVAMQLAQETTAQEEPLIVDPELRAHLEAKVIKSMSLKDIEAMVENDERMRNAPQSKLIIIPKNKITGAEEESQAIIIERKPKTPYAEGQVDNLEYQLEGFNKNNDERRFSFQPEPFRFQNNFRRLDEEIPFFKISDLESAASSPSRQFYESIVSRVMSNGKYGLARDPFDALEISASEDVPRYKPRFDYDAYSKDSTETKLQGKPYWKEDPERRDEMIDENGCRTVIKKIVDPEDEKKSGSNEKAKSVVITKECEYPNLNGPDAKIAGARPFKASPTSRFDQSSDLPATYDIQPELYEDSRPEELDDSSSKEQQSGEGRDPLAPDYIDSMLDKHFKSFPGFTNPLSSFRGYQERFKLRSPEAFKNIKPTVGVQTYEYSHPKSGFEEEEQSRESSEKDSATSPDAPKRYEHHYHYDYPERKPRKPDYNNEEKSEAKSGSDSKEPKMLKKSFAYYRKDKPKDDPNDHQYAEEYAQGNFRSFSSSYDSEKDGPKKKE